jgi:uncharacterized OsmC-like protein
MSEVATAGQSIPSPVSPLTPAAPTDGCDGVRAAADRNCEAVSRDPKAGQGTAVTTIRLRGGLACDVEEGPWRFTVGMAEKFGGTNAGPNPGVYGRAAFGSCIAIGYGIWAARLGVPVDSLEVEVQADYDARGELAVEPTVPPGYLAMRYVVRVASPAPESEVLRLLDTADRFSSWRDDLSRAVPVSREVQYTHSER